MFLVLTFLTLPLIGGPAILLVGLADQNLAAVLIGAVVTALSWGFLLNRAEKA